MRPDYSESLIAARKLLDAVESAARMHDWAKAAAELVKMQDEVAAMNLSLVALQKEGK